MTRIAEIREHVAMWLHPDVGSLTLKRDIESLLVRLDFAQRALKDIQRLGCESVGYHVCPPCIADKALKALALDES